ncbi:MAG: nickel-dependent hydrogenase large subunit [Desulfurivibrio sp.]|nr:MAG: nickel-dependent hydrogenase large subunit [Desulfurivibrio sp.]
MKVDLGPVTRIEGHLNVKTTIENDQIVDAQCMGEMFRGFEVILRGRDPLDAQQITQRICGVCPYAHAIASSYAQENAYGLQVPANGRIMHNLIQGANHLYDYLLHFYQLSALDFVDVTAILKYTGKDADLRKIKEWVQAELASQKAFPGAPFLPRLNGDYLMDDELNIGALKHYVEAMEVQKKANRAAAIFGGKFPHSTAIFPGGCTQAARMDLIASYQSFISETKEFIHSRYIPDIVAVAENFPEYWQIGASKGGFLSYGLLPLSAERNGSRVLAPGVLQGGKVKPVDFGLITQDVGHAKYSSPSGLKIAESSLTPDPGKKGAYTWTKAPRYDGRVMEVGPAARILVDYHLGGNKTVKSLVDTYAAMFGITADNLNSVLGRHLCRAVNAVVIADFLLEESERIDPGGKTMADIVVPATAEGYGVTEASRGALLHYIRIADYKIAAYECVVPTTWNASPRDDKGQPGAMESALVGTKVADLQDQIEAVRIIHSFDPCIACSVH